MLEMRIFGVIMLFISALPGIAQEVRAYDIDRAMEICSSLPLDNLEGVWLYPEDKVTVLILRKENVTASLPTYEISVVESDDTSLLPGEVIGSIESTAESAKYMITLFTERYGNILQKSNSCTASLSNNTDALILKGNKNKKLKLRLNLNVTRLLPNFWRFVRISTNTGSSSTSNEAPVGMIKIYPSYDGNGSSRRQPRYL